MSTRDERPEGRGAAAAAVVGSLVFLVGTVLHPARDGHGVAHAGQLYGVTHAVQAIGLLVQAVALAGLRPVRAGRYAPFRAAGWYPALTGTMAWLALIVYDGAHNPVTARYAPELVHSAADLDAGGAIVVLPALVLFPLGHVLLARQLWRLGQGVVGLLLGAGAVVYTIGGLFIFLAGPRSMLIQPLEIVGALAYAAGFVLLGVRRSTWTPLPAPADAASPRPWSSR